MSLAVAAGWMFVSLMRDGRQKTFLLRRHCCVSRARVPLCPGLYLYPVHARHRQITCNSSHQPSTPVTYRDPVLLLHPFHIALYQGMSSPSYLPTIAGKTEI